MQYHCYGELTSAVPLLPQSQRAHEGLESLFHNLIFRRSLLSQKRVIQGRRTPNHILFYLIHVNSISVGSLVSLRVPYLSIPCFIIHKKSNVRQIATQSGNQKKSRGWHCWEQQELALLRGVKGEAPQL